MIDYLPLLILLLILAALLRQDAVMTVFYLIGGIILISNWWSRQAMKSICFERKYASRAFLKEVVPVRVKVINQGWLPIPWVQIHESLPVALGLSQGYRCAISLSSRGRTEFNYTIYAQKRGYFRVGPLFMRSGDLLGISPDVEIQGEPGYLIVYPRIVPFSKVDLPTHTPFGSLRHTHPAFEDPARVVGKREYRTGDSLRRIDWKTSAASGKLFVRQFGSSVALESMIFLDLNPESYTNPYRLDSLELAITVAASLANWISTKKQAGGICTNGNDPLNENQVARTIPPRKSRAHLLQQLDLLARIEAGHTRSFIDLLQHESPKLTWGAASIVITGTVNDPLFDQLFQMQRRGQNPIILMVGPNRETESSRSKASQFNIPIQTIRTETDLEVWRR